MNFNKPTPATRDSEVKLLEVEDYERSSMSPLSNLGSQTDQKYAANYSMRFSSTGGPLSDSDATMHN